MEHIIYNVGIFHSIYIYYGISVPTLVITVKLYSCRRYTLGLATRSERWDYGLAAPHTVAAHRSDLTRVYQQALVLETHHGLPS